MDDNVALQDILTEIITDAGSTAESASTMDGALSSIENFHPNMIFLDIDMPDGLSLLDKMHLHSPPINIPVIAIRSWGRQIPQDSSLVIGRIEKPFTKSDVLATISSVREEMAEGNEQSIAPIKHAEAAPRAPRTTLAERGVAFGRSYVIFQKSPDAVSDLVSMFDAEGCSVMIVTTRKKKTIIERFRSNNIKALTLKVKLLGGHFNIYGLGTMIDEVEEFIMNNERPVVAFDDLNKIIDRNGMNSTIEAVHQLVTDEYDRERTFLVSVDPAGFTVKDKEILLNHMIHYDPTEG